MKDLIIITIFIVSVNSALSQDTLNIKKYAIGDSVFFEYMLVNNNDTLLVQEITYEYFETAGKVAVKEYSELNNISESKGFKLLSLDKEECDEELYLSGKGIQLLKKKFKKDMLIVKVGFPEECVDGFWGEIEIQENDCINLIYQTNGQVRECMCYFTLTYEIAVQERKDYTFRLNGEKIAKEK